MKSPIVMVTPEAALPGRDTPMPTGTHLVFGGDVRAEVDGAEVAYVAMGCFWGAERIFWRTPGVLLTAVGYQGGLTPHPTYREVCTGLTGHAEVVKVVFDPRVLTYADILRLFFESHDPTQGFRQGADVGTQYRSAIYVVSAEQEATARDITAQYRTALREEGFGEITTEIAPAGPFYFAEPEHQQYLEANPQGYCGIGGTGVTCPMPIARD
jgi:peptide-methionine (S)-S-oxide reductase